MNIFRVVLDTNILVSALLSPQGNPAKIYKMFMSGVVTLVFNTEIFDEYQDVLSRPHLKISPEEMKTVLTAIRQHGEQVSRMHDRLINGEKIHDVMPDSIEEWLKSSHFATQKEYIPKLWYPHFIILGIHE
jgi:putative PIN family toxin of toxin-antitoxin system